MSSDQTASAAHAEQDAPDHWLGQVYRLLHLDAHLSEFREIYRDFDAEAAARTFAEAGFQMVSFMAQDGPSYYPTKVGSMHPGLERDFVGEFSRALKQEGLRCVVYVFVGLGFNSRKLEEETIPQLREILTLYDVDGFFLDITTQPFMRSESYGEPCSELYRKEVGEEVPTDNDDPRGFAFRKWANRHMEAQLDRIYQATSAIKPDVALLYNGAWMFRYPVNPPPYIKHLEWDTAVPDSGLYSCNFSLEGRYLCALPGITWSCMAIDGFAWEDYSMREPEAFMHESALLLAAGGRTYLSDNPYPSGNPDAALMEVYTDVNQRTRALEPYLVGCRPVPEVAVLHSADSLWSKTPVDPIPTWTPGPAYQPVAGAHKALTESHVQMAILNSQVLVETIDAYDAVVLADQRILNPGEVEAIREFVRDGGALLVTGHTGTRDTDNHQLGDFALAEVLGVEYAGSADTSISYLRVEEKNPDYGIPAVDVPVMGASALVRTTTAEVLLERVPPYEGLKTGTPPPAPHTEGPGVTVNAYGKGRAVYCAGPLFEAYYTENTPVLRKLGLWMFDRAHPPDRRAIALDGAPIRVEMFYNQRDSQWGNERGHERFVHLVDYAADKREVGTPYVQDFTAVHGIRIRARLDREPQGVTLVPDGDAVPHEYEDGWLSFSAAPLLIHAVYRIET